MGRSAQPRLHRRPWRSPLGSGLELNGCTWASSLRCRAMDGQAQWPHGEQGTTSGLHGKTKADKHTFRH